MKIIFLQVLVPYLLRGLSFRMYYGSFTATARTFSSPICYGDYHSLYDFLRKEKGDGVLVPYLLRGLSFRIAKKIMSMFTKVLVPYLLRGLSFNWVIDGNATLHRGSRPLSVTGIIIHKHN